MSEKPLPRPNADSLPYWEGCAQHALLYQYCTVCQTAQFPPARHCRSCFAPDPEWRRSAGEGTVHSLTHVHRAPSPAFLAELPYTLALIDFDEGFRIMAFIRSAEHENARIDDRVHIIFEALSQEITLPQVELGRRGEP